MYKGLSVGADRLSIAQVPKKQLCDREKFKGESEGSVWGFAKYG